MAAAIHWGAFAMFKLTAFLCAGLYTAMVFGGADRGQQRFGLLAQPEIMAAKAVAVDTAKPADLPVAQAVFLPEAPLMTSPAVVETASAVTEAVAAPAASEEALLMVVNSKSANVRSGPGTEFDVVGRLTRGESVLVVAQGDGADGWSLIRIEGDGVEGYIATRLLAE